MTASLTLNCYRFIIPSAYYERAGKLMRIKLTLDQLNSLAKDLPFTVMLDKPSDVRGLLEILGKEMPWDETGLSKLSDNSPRRPLRVTFSVEESGDGYICDIHPALVHHLYTILSKNR